MDQEVDRYISSQREVMAQNKQKWQGLIDECDSTEQNYRQAVAQQNAQAQKQYQEQMGQLGEFCFKYNRMRNAGPGAGCSGPHYHTPHIISSFLGY